MNEKGEKSLGSGSFLPKFGRRFSVGANWSLDFSNFQGVRIFTVNKPSK